ncbi:MAG: GNAT family N-acetyltransferase [Promethearchaeota archaeon]
MSIILANESHIPQIIEVWKEFMDYHKNLDSFFSRRDDGHLNFKNYVSELIKSKEALVLVALDEGNVVGYSIALMQYYPPVFKQRVYGLINDMAIKETHRRRGIGGQLLSRIYEWFNYHNLNRIELRVSVNNPIGYSFWKKHGFKDYMHVLFLEKE